MSKFSRGQIDDIFLVSPRKHDLTFPRGHVTLRQCGTNVDATSWRCTDIDATLFKRHVPALLSFTKDSNQHCLFPVLSVYCEAEMRHVTSFFHVCSFLPRLHSRMNA